VAPCYKVNADTVLALVFLKKIRLTFQALLFHNCNIACGVVLVKECGNTPLWRRHAFTLVENFKKLGDCAPVFPRVHYCWNKHTWHF